MQSVVLDFDIDFEREKDRTMFPWNDKKGFRHWILSSLLSARWSQLLDMIECPSDRDSLIVDIGCNIGWLTQPLSLRAKTVGLDIDKKILSATKACKRDLELVCCDLCYLPLRNSSVDIAVCASVFEHVENLSKAIEEITLILKKKGKLAAGYPIETKLLEFIIKSFYKSEFMVWDQTNISKKRYRTKNPHTHKQSFSEIRRLLRRNFSTLKIRKMPIGFLPDFLSIYENVILLKIEKREL